MDKYDEQIAYLTEHPEDIRKAWCKNNGHLELFKTLGDDIDRFGNIDAGCVSQIKGYSYTSAGCGVFINGRFDEEFTKEIFNDPTVPEDVDFVTIESLPRFAYYQRKYDALVAGTVHEDDNDFHPDRDCYN